MKTIDSLSPLFPRYEGIVVPSQYYHEFLGALTTAAALQGIRESKIAWSQFPAAETYRHLKHEINTPVRSSPIASINREGRFTEMVGEQKAFSVADHLHFSPLDAWCVEAGLLAQAKSLRSSTDSRSDQYWPYNRISLAQADRKERLSEMVVDAVHNSEYQPIMLPMLPNSQSY